MFKLSNQQINELKKDFETLDTNKDGAIKRGELTKLLNGVGIQPSEEKMEELMNEID